MAMIEFELKKNGKGSDKGLCVLNGYYKMWLPRSKVECAPGKDDDHLVVKMPEW